MNPFLWPFQAAPGGSQSLLGNQPQPIATPVPRSLLGTYDPRTPQEKAADAYNAASAQASNLFRPGAWWDAMVQGGPPVGSGVGDMTIGQALDVAAAGTRAVQGRPRWLEDSLIAAGLVPLPGARAETKAAKKIAKPFVSKGVKLPVKATVDPYGFGTKQWAEKPLNQYQITRIPDPNAPMAAENIMSPTQFAKQYEGSLIVPSPWDMSLGGHIVTNIEGIPVHVPARGGPKFQLTHAQHGLAGASDIGVVTKHSNQVEELMRKFPGARILMTPAAMGPHGIDFSHHPADAILATLPYSKLSNDDVNLLNRLMREKGYTDTGAKTKANPSGYQRYVFPDFPGMRSPKLREWLDKSGNNRKGFIKTLDRNKEALTTSIMPPGLARYAMTDPEMYGAPLYSSGRYFAEVKPGAVRNYPNMHPSYPVGMPGTYVAGLEQLYPYQRMYSDWWKNVGSKAANPLRAFYMGGADRAQLINDQWLNQLLAP